MFITGFKDSKFYVKNDEIYFSGDRYSIGKELKLSKFKKLAFEKYQLSAEHI